MISILPKILKLIPKNETLWLQALDKDNNLTHVITSDQHRDYYKLYEVTEDKLIYTKHKSNDPTDLYRYIWDDG